MKKHYKVTFTHELKADEEFKTILGAKAFAREHVTPYFNTWEITDHKNEPVTNSERGGKIYRKRTV